MEDKKITETDELNKPLNTVDPSIVNDEEIIDISSLSDEEQINFLANVVSDLDHQEEKDQGYKKVLKSDKK